MAIIQVTYMSQALWRTVPVQVILPVDKFNSGGSASINKEFKTLYLLHGLLGSSADWLLGTRIQRLAEERNLAVVMPSGDNSFYIDRPESNNRYGEFVGKELVEMTRRMFPLSDKLQDTFIGGLSMGGFGAVRNGLKYHDTFGAVLSLSGALHVFEGLDDKGRREDHTNFIEHEISVFGPLNEAVLTDKNPRVLIDMITEEKIADRRVSLPRIYMACGVQDKLLPYNRIYAELFAQKGFDVTYEEAQGDHNWDFWDKYIEKALDWLPLEDKSQGLNSGNVH